MIDPVSHALLMKKIYALLPAELTDGDYPTTDEILDLISVVPLVSEHIQLIVVVQDGKPIGRRRKDGSLCLFPLPITFGSHPED